MVIWSIFDTFVLRTLVLVLRLPDVASTAAKASTVTLMVYWRSIRKCYSSMKEISLQHVLSLMISLGEIWIVLAAVVDGAEGADSSSIAAPGTLWSSVNLIGEVLSSSDTSEGPPGMLGSGYLRLR